MNARSTVGVTSNWSLVFVVLTDTVRNVMDSIEWTLCLINGSNLGCLSL